MWEQLAGLFEARDGAAAARSVSDPWPSPHAQSGDATPLPDEPWPALAPLPEPLLPSLFEHEHLDVDLPFDGSQGAFRLFTFHRSDAAAHALPRRSRAAVDDWLDITVGAPEGATMQEELEVRARGRRGGWAARELGCSRKPDSFETRLRLRARIRSPSHPL